MRKPDIRYWVLWLFLLGVLVIVFLQVISGYNISRLLEGNRQLTAEMQVQYSLRKLQSDIIGIESDLRGAVISNNKSELTTIEPGINSVANELRNINQYFTSNQVTGELNTLNYYVKEKIRHSQNVMEAFRNS